MKDAGVSATVNLTLPVPDAHSQSYYKPETQVAEHISPPFFEEAKVTLKVSQNLHASMTPYILGAVLGKATKTPYKRASISRASS